MALMKDNQRVSSFVKNFAGNATAVENCFVNQIAASDSQCNVDMEIPCGIYKGMSKADLDKAIEGSSYTQTDESSYIRYYISDERSVSYGYEIIVKEDVISKIEADFQPKQSE